MKTPLKGDPVPGYSSHDLKGDHKNSTKTQVSVMFQETPEETRITYCMAAPIKNATIRSVNSSGLSLRDEPDCRDTPLPLAIEHGSGTFETPAAGLTDFETSHFTPLGVQQNPAVQRLSQGTPPWTTFLLSMPSIATAAVEVMAGPPLWGAVQKGLLAGVSAYVNMALNEEFNPEKTRERLKEILQSFDIFNPFQIFYAAWAIPSVGTVSLASGVLASENYWSPNFVPALFFFCLGTGASGLQRTGGALDLYCLIFKNGRGLSTEYRDSLSRLVRRYPNNQNISALVTLSPFNKACIGLSKVLFLLGHPLIAPWYASKTIKAANLIVTAAGILLSLSKTPRFSGFCSDEKYCLDVPVYALWLVIPFAAMNNVFFHRSGYDAMKELIISRRLSALAYNLEYKHPQKSSCCNKRKKMCKWMGTTPIFPEIITAFLSTGGLTSSALAFYGAGALHKIVMPRFSQDTTPAFLGIVLVLVVIYFIFVNGGAIARKSSIINIRKIDKLMRDEPLRSLSSSSLSVLNSPVRNNRSAHLSLDIQAETPQPQESRCVML